MSTIEEIDATMDRMRAGPTVAPDEEDEGNPTSDKRCDFCGTVNDAHHSAECVDRRARKPMGGPIPQLEALRDNAYTHYIEACRKDACLGFDAKCDNQMFGRAELRAHEEAAEWLGRHRALAEVVKRLKGWQSKEPGDD